MVKELLKAARFAKKAHAGQKRKHGAPYYKHPMAVARILWDNGHRNPDLLKAAYLHDTLEDTKTTLEELVKEFGAKVAYLVYAVSKAKYESLEEHYTRIKEAGPDAVALKVADREHNNSELKYVPADNVKLREKAKLKTELMTKVFGL